jgi:hypothetical protein
MVFDPIRAKISVFGGIGSPVFDVEVMFETAIKVEADIISVVTGEAVGIIRFDKEMRNQLPIVKGEVAGCTAGAVSNCGVAVSGTVGVAAKTSPSKQIVCKFQTCCGGLA